MAAGKLLLTDAVYKSTLVRVARMSRVSVDHVLPGSERRKRKKKHHRPSPEEVMWGNPPEPLPNLQNYNSKSAFVVIFRTMSPDKMMTLKSGTIVEELFLAQCKMSDRFHLIHSFVLNPFDKSQQELFMPQDWDEIITCAGEARTGNTLRPPLACLSSVPDDVKSISALREAINQLGIGDRDQEWVNAVYRKIIVLVGHPHNPLTLPLRHNESWLEIMLHCDLVYQCLMSVDNIEIVTKEAISQATRAFLNQDRTETGKGHYLIPSPRLDSIFKLNTLNGLELGASEVAPHNNGREDTKHINDFNKLAVNLSHMLRRLHREVKTARQQELQVVGLLWSGLTLRVLRMWSPNGCICFLDLEEPVTVPSDEKRIKDVRLVLEAVSGVRDTIQHTVNLIFSA